MVNFKDYVVGMVVEYFSVKGWWLYFGLGSVVVFIV